MIREAADIAIVAVDARQRFVEAPAGRVAPIFRARVVVTANQRIRCPISVVIFAVANLLRRNRSSAWLQTLLAANSGTGAKPEFVLLIAGGG